MIVNSLALCFLDTPFSSTDHHSADGSSRETPVVAQSPVGVLGFVALAFLPGADIVHNNINNVVSCVSGIRKMRWIVQYTLVSPTL